MRRLTIVAALTAALVCSSFATADCTKRVLFIGNSYTYYNELPKIVAEMAKAGHQCTLDVRMIAPGGARLEDHWNDANTRAVVRDEHWDFVVLQEQSTLGAAQPTTDQFFLPFAKKWAEEIHRIGAEPVFFMTWSRERAPQEQAFISDAYLRAAKETKSAVAPVGIAWERVRRIYPNIELYEKDGSHPSPAGSDLAACVIYATLFHQSPEGLPSKFPKVLQSMAWWSVRHVER